MIKAGIRKWAAPAWLMVLIGLVAAVWIMRPPLDSSILSMLPENQAQPLLQRAQDQIGAEFSQRLVIVVRGESASATRTQTTAIAGQLAANPAVADVTWQASAKQAQAIRDFYAPYRFQVLDPALRDELEKGEFKRVRQQAELQLFSPMGAGRAEPVKDPFGLTNRLMQTLAEGKVQADGGLLRIIGAKPAAYLIAVKLNGTAFDTDLQQQILPALTQWRQQAADNGVQLFVSGLLQHAAAGAEQARSEISTIGLVSLISVLGLTLLVFRSVQAPVLIVLSVVAGCIAAVAVTALVFGRLHLIALAFGAGLVGVSVDYGLHYLAAQREKSRVSVIRRILPGLALGGVSSVLAYGAQALAPFPGLRQMACFSAAGLAGAWLTVVLWYPLLTRRFDQQPLPAAHTLGRLLARWPTLNPRASQYSLLVIAGLSVVLLWTGQAQDDVRLLRMSPDSLMQQEKSVQTLLHLDSTSRFFLVSGESAEQILQREETIVRQLDRQREHDPDLRYTALSTQVPSHHAQQQNEELVSSLYDQQAAAFFDTLSKPELLARAIQAKADAQGRRLTVDNWLQSPLAQAHSNLWLQQDGQPPLGLVRLTGITPAMSDALATIADGVEGVYYVDTVDQLSRLLSHYRIEISYWVAAAYLIVGLLLLVRYRGQCWRVIGPPLVAGLLVAGLLSHYGAGLNLFNVLALLLVLGIGLDMGIFLQEGAGSDHIWVAVTLSVLTSLLAFGLLVLSQTPVLHHFGLTVLLGLTAIWIIAVSIRSPLSCKDSVVP